ncbi:hypothetical protein KUCAC02_020366, partial [Chaenocephalus aceratus]
GTPHLASPSSRSEHLEATQDFTHNTILLLLDLTKTHQQGQGPLYLNRRGEHNVGILWDNGQPVWEPGPSMTLPTTLPCASEAQPGPSTTLPTTLPCASEAQPGASTTLPTTLPCASEGQPGPSTTLPTTLPCASEGQPGPSMTLPTTQPRSIRSRVSHPSFYDLYEAHSERRTSALETLVRPEQERRRRLKERNRRRFEAKMLTAMGEVVSQLKSIGSQQERIIELLQDKPNMPSFPPHWVFPELICL